MSSTDRASTGNPPIRLGGLVLRRSGLGVAFLAVCGWIVLGLFPLYWALITSLKPQTSVARMPPAWLPRPFSLSSWETLLGNPDVLRWLGNSFIVATATTTGTVLFGGMAGYAFAKGRFVGRRSLFSLVVVLIMVSSQVLIVPIFVMLKSMHMLDTYWGLILPALASPFGVFLAKQFMQTLPDELFDAARIDGCSEIGLCFRIAMPLSKPVLAIIAVFSFLGTWNEFIYPLIITNSNEMRTLPVGLALLQNQYSLDYGLLMAAAILTTAPPLVLFLFMQRFLVRGITIGAIRG